MSASPETFPSATRFARRLRSTRPAAGLVSAIVGVVCGLAVLAFVVIGPLVIPYDPDEIDLLNRFAPISIEHWLGTDALGRDLAARIADGGRVTLMIALASVALGTAIALPIGLLTGYSRGVVDIVGTRVIDLFFAIPSLLIAIGVVAIFGPSLRTTIFALGIGYWAVYARLIRGTVVQALAQPYVDQSRVMGARSLRVLRVDVLPSLLSLMLVQTAVLLGFAILDEAALGFLGLGVQPPAASWGSILSDAREVILVEPRLSLIAGIPIVLAVVSINLLSDLLARRLDARYST